MSGARRDAAAPLGIRATFALAARTLRDSLPVYLLAVVVLQGGAVLVGVPLVVALFDAALRTAGVRALTHLNVGHVLTSPPAVVLLLVAGLAVGLIVLVQQGAFLAIGDRLQVGAPVTVRALAGDLGRAARKLLNPQLLLFLVYVAGLVPLGGFGIAGFLVRGIAIPDFVIAELLKFDGGIVVYAIFLGGVLWLNLRLVLTLAVLITSDASVAGALAASWRMTRGITWRLLVAIGAVAAVVVVLVAGIVSVALAPTRFADVHVPAAAPVVAGVSLTAVQVVGVVLAGSVAALLTQVVVAVARGRRPLGGVRFTDPAADPDSGPVAVPDGAEPGPSTASPRVVDGSVPDGASPAGSLASSGAGGSSGGGSRGLTRRTWVRAAVGLGLVAVLVGATVVNTRAVSGLAGDRGAVVVAHRGYYANTVENTIPALEAAAALGVDYVELDVLQAGDGGLVVFHDTTLRRLGGSSRAVADMTLDELTATTLRQDGNEASIPSLEEFVDRARELDVPLLVELKLHGRERPGFVDDVVALLREREVATTYPVQSIYPEVVAEVRAVGPEIRVGLVAPFLRGGLGTGAVDFVAVEQSSVTDRVLAEARAARVDVLVWTVNDPVAMRRWFATSADGVITGNPRRAVAEREAALTDPLVAVRLEDLLREALRW